MTAAERHAQLERLDIWCLRLELRVKTWWLRMLARYVAR